MAFTSQITGSPFTTPHNNITAMAYTNVSNVKRIYYCQAGDFTKIYCMSTTGTADTTREISIQNQGDARTSTCRGLTSDGTYLYAITGALGNQYLHVYRLSDRTYIANAMLGFQADHYARGIATFPRPDRTTERRINFLQDNIVRSYTIAISGQTATLTQQHDGTFTLPTNEMVTSGNWQSITWDDTTSRLLIVAEASLPTPGFPGNFTDQDKVFGFSYTGSRDDREDFLPGIDADAMSYNGDDDDLYLVHETSTNLYAWGDYPRFNLGNTSLTITEGTTYTLDLKPLVDSGATFSMQTDISDGFYDNLTFSNGVLLWTDPPAPRGGATQQNVPLRIRATLGAQNTDHTFPFILHAMARVAVPPVFSTTAFPTQIVYEPYTPPAGAITPNLAHGFAINLSDYLAAGTPPFTFTARTDGSDFPGTFSITRRFVNQHPINDRLVFNASAVNASQLNRFIAVTVGNPDNPNNSTQNLPIEVINLMYPSWTPPSTTLNIDNSTFHSYPLLDWITGEPQVDFEFVGTPDASIHAAITNNNLMLRATPGMQAVTHPITIKAKNILTGDAGIDQTFNVTVAARTLPPSAPVWLTGTLTLTGNRGEMQRINLNQYIASGNPQPTYEVHAPSGVLGTIMGSIEGQHFFEFTIPNTITADYNATVDITATNSVDSAVKTFNVHGIFTAQPAFDEIPQQTVKPGEVWELDLKQHVTGTPTPTIAWNPEPSGTPEDGSNATLVNGVARWEAPSSISTIKNVFFSFRASNDIGHADIRLRVEVNTQVKPSWKPEEIVIAATEGDVVRQPLDAYVMGNPTPTLHLGSDISDIPGPNSITFDGLTIIINPSVEVISQLAFRFNVIADSPIGSATKEITVDVTPIFVDSHEITLTTADYYEIRKLVNTNLGEKELPDKVISGDTVIGAAVEWAIERMPVVDQYPRTIEELKAKRRAILFRTAAYLSTSIRESRDVRIEGIDATEFQLASVLHRKAEESADFANRRLIEAGHFEDTIEDTIGFFFDVVDNNTADVNIQVAIGDNISQIIGDDNVQN